MPRRRDTDPSALRTGLVHASLSLGLFGGLSAALGAGIHFTGDPEAASPRVSIALFDAPASASGLVLKARLDADFPTGRRLNLDTATLTDGNEPSLGVEYVEPSVRTASLEEVSGEGSADVRRGIRINGKVIKPGESYGETTTIVALPDVQVSRYSERVNGLTLPAIAADGRAPSDVYARAFANPKNKPVVSLIVGGLGINAGNTKAAIEDLPPEVTLSFAPDANRLQYWIDKARAAGHEVLIEVPMEAHEYGRMKMHPLTLLAGSSEAENTARLDQLLGRATGYFGVVNYQGAKFAGETKAAKPVLTALAARGLALVEDGSLTGEGLGTLADSAGLEYSRAALPVDTKLTAVDITSQFMELEAVALEKGVAMGSAYAFPLTIEMAKTWCAELPEKGLVLAPVSATAARTPVAMPKAPKKEARISAPASGRSSPAPVDPKGS